MNTLATDDDYYVEMSKFSARFGLYDPSCSVDMSSNPEVHSGRGRNSIGRID